MEENNNNCTFSRLLSFIDKLQRNAQCNQSDDSTCLRPFLGSLPFVNQYNTRPVTFYDRNNDLIAINYSTDGTTTGTEQSNVFRIQSVEDCYVVVTLLIPNPNVETQATIPYVSTNQTAIINLNCVCAIKCLNDTTIDL